jgi:hypothetical protein
VPAVSLRPFDITPPTGFNNFGKALKANHDDAPKKKKNRGK